jgi:hypothetical protein
VVEGSGFGVQGSEASVEVKESGKWKEVRGKG